MATSPSNRSVSQAPQSLLQVRFPGLRKELLRLESGRLFAGVSVGEPWRRSVEFVTFCSVLGLQKLQELLGLSVAPGCELLSDALRRLDRFAKAYPELPCPPAIETWVKQAAENPCRLVSQPPRSGGVTPPRLALAPNL